MINHSAGSLKGPSVFIRVSRVGRGSPEQSALTGAVKWYAGTNLCQFLKADNFQEFSELVMKPLVEWMDT